MKKISKKDSLILISIGMFVIAFSQITTRFVEIPDFFKGSLTGIGIGFLILKIIFNQLRPVEVKKQ